MEVRAASQGSPTNIPTPPLIKKKNKQQNNYKMLLGIEVLQEKMKIGRQDSR